MPRDDRTEPSQRIWSTATSGLASHRVMIQALSLKPNRSPRSP